jgi:hypothetical protein
MMHFILTLFAGNAGAGKLQLTKAELDESNEAFPLAPGPSSIAHAVDGARKNREGDNKWRT